jgi:DNA-binding MarR family transcriptional regulator
MNSLPFGFDHPDDSPGFLLWQTTLIWQRHIKKALDPHGISHAQFVIMATLMWFEGQNADTTQTLLVGQTKLDKMTVSQSLKKLVALGLVNRHEHDRDTRAKRATLTPKGKSLVYTLVPVVEGIDARFFGVTTAMEEQYLKKLLKKLIEKGGI